MSETIQCCLLLLNEFHCTNTMIIDERLPPSPVRKPNQNHYHYCYLVCGQIQDKHILSPRSRRLSNLTQLELVSSNHSLDFNCCRIN